MPKNKDIRHLLHWKVTVLTCETPCLSAWYIGGTQWLMAIMLFFFQDSSLGSSRNAPRNSWLTLPRAITRSSCHSLRSSSPFPVFQAHGNILGVGREVLSSEAIALRSPEHFCGCASAPLAWPSSPLWKLLCPVQTLYAHPVYSIPRCLNCATECSGAGKAETPALGSSWGMRQSWHVLRSLSLSA